MSARFHPLSHPVAHPLRAQSGVALVVVLIFMLALAGIAIISARSALLGEALSRNQLDIQVARQAAEAALRDAERDLLLTADPPGAVCWRDKERPTADNEGLFNDTCIRGQCSTAMSDLNSSDYIPAGATTVVREAWWPTANGGRWNDAANTKPSAADRENTKGRCDAFTGGVPLGTFTGTPALVSVAQQPEYLLEQLKRSGTVYRITARGFGYRVGTEVVMQSYFQVPTF